MARGADPGQCGLCAHARLVRSARGSIFHLCQRAGGDPAFARYPELPMHDCPGFTGAPTATPPTAAASRAEPGPAS